MYFLEKQSDTKRKFVFLLILLDWAIINPLDQSSVCNHKLQINTRAS